MEKLLIILAFRMIQDVLWLGIDLIGSIRLFGTCYNCLYGSNICTRTFAMSSERNWRKSVQNSIRFQTFETECCRYYCLDWVTAGLAGCTNRFLESVWSHVWYATEAKGITSNGTIRSSGDCLYWKKKQTEHGCRRDMAELQRQR